MTMTAKEFILALPSKAAPESVAGLNTNFYFDLAGEGGGQFSVVLDGEKVNVHEGMYGEPKCTVKIKADNLIKIIKGEMNPMMAMLTGKLKISNQGEMLKYAKVFGLM